MTVENAPTQEEMTVERATQNLAFCIEDYETKGRTTLILQHSLQILGKHIGAGVTAATELKGALAQVKALTEQNAELTAAASNVVEEAEPSS